MNGRMTLVSCLTLLCALLAAACGSAATEQATPVEQQAPTSTTAPGGTAVEEEPTATEEAGPSILRVGGVEGPDCLNLWSCAYTWFHQYLANEGLTGTGPRCDVFPRLAKSWEVSEDGLTWTFHLNEGARFTDGTPVDAHTVAEWMEWFNSTELKWWYYTSWNMTEVEALDDYTLQFTTEAPLNPNVVLGYDLVWWWVFPPHIWSALSEDEVYTYEELPDGTGPYDMVEYVPGQYVIYDAKPDYYMGKPPIDRIVFQVFANWDAVVQALLAGEIDVTDSYLPIQYYSALIDEPGIVVEEQPPGYTRNIYFNMSEGGKKHPAIDDPAVREAIDFAVDKEWVLDVALEGHGLLCPNVFCGGLRKDALDPDLTVTPFDPEKAKQILTDAGYLDADGDGIRETSDGLPLNFRIILESGQPEDLAIADHVGASLAEIGISTEAEVVDLGTLSSYVLEERDYDIAVHRFWPDLDPMLLDFYFSCWSAEAGASAINRPGYCNSEVDDLIYAYATTRDPKEAIQYAYQAQEIIANDRPMITLAGSNMIEALRTDRFEFPIPGESCDMNPGHWNWPLVLQAQPK